MLQSFTLAALAFMPGVFWIQIFRSMRRVLMFTLVVSIGGYAFARMALYTSARRFWAFITSWGG